MYYIINSPKPEQILFGHMIINLENVHKRYRMLKRRFHKDKSKHTFLSQEDELLI